MGVWEEWSPKTKKVVGRKLQEGKGRQMVEGEREVWIGWGEQGVMVVVWGLNEKKVENR